MNNQTERAWFLRRALLICSSMRFSRSHPKHLFPPVFCGAIGLLSVLVPPSAMNARDAVSMPAPAPQHRSGDVAAVNASCESCHTEIAAEWKSSLHRQAHTDPVYQRALAIEPLSFCQACHAPEADPKKPVPNAIGALGVGCVTCHLTGNDVLAVPKIGATNSVTAHGIVRDNRFATPAACGACHEFAFPDAGKRSKPELMQSTISEHAASKNSQSSCADCHMPFVPDNIGSKKHRSHVFDASRNPTMVRQAVTIQVVRTGPTTAQVTLTPAVSGHALPTGDLFRRLEIHVDAVGAEYQAVASSTKYLMRHFAERKHGAGIVRYVKSDDRPLNAPVVVELNLGPEALALPMAYRIAYQRVEHPRSEKPEDSVVDGEVVLSEGILPSLGKKQ